MSVTVTVCHVPPPPPVVDSVTITVDHDTARDLMLIAGRTFSWGSGGLGTTMHDLWRALGASGVDPTSECETRITNSRLTLGAVSEWHR